MYKIQFLLTILIYCLISKFSLAQDGDLYHENGRVAFDSSFQAVYFDNQQRAFDCTVKSIHYKSGLKAYEPKHKNIYYENGNIAFNSLYKNVYYSNGNNAFISKKKIIYDNQGNVIHDISELNDKGYIIEDENLKITIKPDKTIKFELRLKDNIFIYMTDFVSYFRILSSIENPPKLLRQIAIKQ